MALAACGKGSLSRQHPEKPNTFQYVATSCKKLTCSECGPKKASAYKKAIFTVAAKHRLQRHLTLTLDPGLIPADRDSTEYIQQVWCRYRTFLKEHRGLKLSYVRVLEYQENGTAHFHLLIGQTVAQDTLLAAWVACGGGHQVRIRFRDGGRGAAYITKYITKELLLEIPEGTRRVSTSRGIRLFEPHVSSGWEYSRRPLWVHLMNCFRLRWQDMDSLPAQHYFESDHPPVPDEFLDGYQESTDAKNRRYWKEKRESQHLAA